MHMLNNNDYINKMMRLATQLIRAISYCTTDDMMRQTNKTSASSSSQKCQIQALQGK